MQVIYEKVSDVVESRVWFASKNLTDEFSEKFQTVFDPPPPHFRKIMLQIFYMDMVEYMQGGTRAR